MKLKEALDKHSNNITRGPKGALAYKSTLDSNLDYFYKASRFGEDEEIEKLFTAAYEENPKSALASLLNYLDVRKGKGERQIFKKSFKTLCELNPEDARLILTFIPELGRWDYILVGLDTAIEEDIFLMIQNQLEEDLKSEHPSLLAKWLPSLRTHGKNNPVAFYIAEKLGLTQKEYRKTLGSLRKKLEVTERLMSDNNWTDIDFSNVPTKAMIKYQAAFHNHLDSELRAFLKQVQTGEEKINTKGLFCYEIIRSIYRDEDFKIHRYRLFFDQDENCIESLKIKDITDVMWEEQEDFLAGDNSNLLVVADTSGSMFVPDLLPISASLGLALYIAERNHGIFKDHFITFSSNPIFQKIEGDTVREKLLNIKEFIENTDIDKVFRLILSIAQKHEIKPEDMPTKILILSDMAFDYSVDSENDTNFEVWKKLYKEAGYPFPQIIFWNLAEDTFGTPVTERENDVIMLNGFSSSILKDILPLDEITPVAAMEKVLEKYKHMIDERKLEIKL